MDKEKVLIGTSGWNYKHWKGLFYPTGCAQRSWLEYYARHFDTVEINASFYRLPTVTTVTNWRDTVGKSFYFCPKISRFVTHAKKLKEPELSAPRFFDVFSYLSDKMGPVLIQLPPQLVFQQQTTEYFFRYVKQYYSDFRFSLEARHKSWMNAEVFALLKKLGVGWVIAESGTRFASKEAVTARHVYLRFHGPDGSYASSYSKPALRNIAAVIRQYRDDGHRVWCFFNNDLHGFAISNALALKEMLG